MKLYKTNIGTIIEQGDRYFLAGQDWDELVNMPELYKYVARLMSQLEPLPDGQSRVAGGLMPPVGRQEIWASGVTYHRSKEARREESKGAGGGDFYERVYHAERPELFFKSTAARAIGHGGKVRIRRDSRWNVPEPELTLFINSRGEIAGYTIGNDMSSRDIEGENPLYLPQAKTYDGAAAIGPCLYIQDHPFAKESVINLEIIRDVQTVFSGQTQVSQIKREFEQLVQYLFRETSFPHGVFLMTGTGIVPPDNFTLQSGDEIRIAIDHIGILANTVE